MSTGMMGKLRLVGETLDSEVDWAAFRGTALYEKVAEVLGKPDRPRAYLLLGVLESAIPTVERVESLAREWALDGVEKILRRTARKRIFIPARRQVSVHSGVLVDVTDTCTSSFVTGIQRVARETVKQWSGVNSFTLVRWGDGDRTVREVKSSERARVVGSEAGGRQSRGGVIIPFNGTYVLPEIAVDRPRADGIRSIAKFGCQRSIAIGFDCIPVTTAETAGDTMPGAFSRYLSSLAQFTEVEAISAASAVEFMGWKHMLSGAGIEGPKVRELTLPFEGGTADGETIRMVRCQLGLKDDTVVLSVGSHEPRKNHLNLLHAAEACWRAGHEFTLVFAGGNAWKSERFFELVDRLRSKGRRIVTLSGVDDSVIWSLYSIAKVSVFCSLNEGFGLPVVESLANGTPVITSDFGSMKELSEGRGAILVDPRSPEAISAALHRIFSEESLYARLLAETENLPRSTWADYARQLWEQVAHPAIDAAPSADKTSRKGSNR